MTAADPNPYAPDAAQQAENERVVRLAVHLIAASYANERRPKNATLRAEMRRADRRARGLVEWDRKRGRA
jgi:hypothetical protein